MYRDLRRCTPRHWIITYILTPQFSWCCLKRGAKHTERFRSFKVGSSAPFDRVQSEGKSTLEKAKKGLNGLSKEWKICQVSMTKNYVQTKVHPALHTVTKCCPAVTPGSTFLTVLWFSPATYLDWHRKVLYWYISPTLKKKKKNRDEEKSSIWRSRGIKKEFR